MSETEFKAMQIAVKAILKELRSKHDKERQSADSILHGEIVDLSKKTGNPEKDERAGNLAAQIKNLLAG